MMVYALIGVSALTIAIGVFLYRSTSERRPRQDSEDR
jgi:hypothetical protein